MDMGIPCLARGVETISQEGTPEIGAGGSTGLRRYSPPSVKTESYDAFNRCHTIPYSTTALQEMNLFHKYGSIYWQCACLTVNASAIDDDEDAGNVKYGKTAKAQKKHL